MKKRRLCRFSAFVLSAMLILNSFSIPAVAYADEGDDFIGDEYEDDY